MAQQSVTVTGNLTDDPKLKELVSGGYVGEIRIASNRAFRDEKGENGWRVYDQLYISGELWNDLAVNVRKSLTKGMPVIATGVLITHEWQDRNFENRKVQKIVLKINQIGLDLNRYVVGSKRSDIAERNFDGLEIPDADVSSLIDDTVGHKQDNQPADSPESEMATAGVQGASEPSSEGGDEAPF